MDDFYHTRHKVLKTNKLQLKKYIFNINHILKNKRFYCRITIGLHVKRSPACSASRTSFSFLNQFRIFSFKP